MRRVILSALGVIASMAFWATVLPVAHADLISCPYPGVGSQLQIQVIASAGGFYCDDPIEINGAHMHCQSGNGGIGFSGGATGPGGGGLTNTFGFGNFQIGAAKWDCGWVCPPRPGDQNILYATIGPPAAQPNPPGAWKDKLKPMVCSIYNRGGPYDANSLPPAGLNPFYEASPPPPDDVGPPRGPVPGPQPGNGQAGTDTAPVSGDPTSLQPTGG